MVTLRTWQITVGFDSAVSPEEIAALLAERYGRVQLGKGVAENGIPTGCIHVENGAGDER
jgi:hypothetical protein